MTGTATIFQGSLIPTKRSCIITSDNDPLVAGNSIGLYTKRLFRLIYKGNAPGHLLTITALNC